MLRATGALALSLVLSPAGCTGSTDAGPTRETCDLYVACASSTAPSEMGDILDAYGDDGSCWSGSQEQAEQCYAACDEGLQELRESSDDATCWPDECGAFMAAYNACGAGIHDEHLCGEDHAAWRDCVEPSLDSCSLEDELTCQDLLPLPEGAIYGPGTWSATWSVFEVSESCYVDGEGFSEAVAATDTVQVHGDGLGDFTLDFKGPLIAKADCSLGGSEWSCLHEQVQEEGVVRLTLEGSFLEVTTGSAGVEVYLEEDGSSCSIQARLDVERL